MNCPLENPVVYFPSTRFRPMIQIAHVVKRLSVAASVTRVFVCS
jgi:hypothetical protein